VVNSGTVVNKLKKGFVDVCGFALEAQMETRSGVSQTRASPMKSFNLSQRGLTQFSQVSYIRPKYSVSRRI